MNCSKCNDTNSKNSLVYLDKVFYDNTQNASPILTQLTTTTNTFTQQLNVGRSGCGCGCVSVSNDGCGCDNLQRTQNSRSCGCGCDCCCNIDINPGTTFDINNVFVIVHSFGLVNNATLTENDVTVDGFPVTDLDAAGGQFVGDLSGIMSEITKCPCKSPCDNQCPGNFVLITADGPWNLEATIVVEGTLTSNGTSCQFRLCFAPIDGSPVVINGGATFSFCGVDIPCQKGRISPSLILDFDACASLLNPRITVNNMNGNSIAVLTGSLVVTPQVGLKVTRPSLFNLSAMEVDVPCDDVGQCNPCNVFEAECFDLEDNCCACDEAAGNTVQQRQSTLGNACQCCDTNGFGFF